jgi:hypothetical protein
MSRLIQKDDEGEGQANAEAESLPEKPSHAITSRMQAIVAELDRASAEYTRCRAERDATNVRFEAARERFASVKRIANNILGGEEWWHWAFRNRNVMFAGMPIGVAVRDALAFHAIDCAIESRGDRARYDPAVTMEQIYQKLDDGGFEFTSNAPRREVNAALMKQEGVKKLDDGRYEAEDAEDMFAICFPNTKAEG